MIGRTVLSICDFSGEWPKPYRAAGYKVIQWDLKLGQDVRLMELPTEPIWEVLCAPPCTDLAASGARWWAAKGEQALLDALSIADACLRIVTFCKPRWWALENPIGRLSRFYGPPAFSFDPADFGDPYTKRTLLWGNFTPPLPLFVGEHMAVEATEGSKMWAKYGGSSERTKTLRSTTPAGFAQAFFKANP